MITIQERFPWYMALAGGVGAIGLLVGIVTLTQGFEPLFGSILVAGGAAALLDTLALVLTVWSIQSIRQGTPAGLVRTAAHGCILVSVTVQATVAFQGLAGTLTGWLSAFAHTLAPLILGLVLELIYQYFALKWRQKTAPVRAAEVLNVQLANAVFGLPVRVRDIQRAGVEAVRAGLVNPRSLTSLLAPADLKRIPALRALHAAIDPEGARELTARIESEQRAIGERSESDHFADWTPLFDQSNTPSAQPEHSEHPEPEPTDSATRDKRIRDLTTKNLSTRDIARLVGCAPSTVSVVQRATTNGHVRS